VSSLRKNTLLAAKGGAFAPPLLPLNLPLDQERRKEEDVRVKFCSAQGHFTSNINAIVCCSAGLGMGPHAVNSMAQ